MTIEDSSGKSWVDQIDAEKSLSLKTIRTSCIVPKER